MLKAFNNILIVVKQTPYEQYLQLKAQGKAPVALRWERLKNRYNVHKTCVDDVTSIIDNIGIKYSIIGREELHRGSIQDKDLVIAVGGDGTVLNTASFVDDSIPVLGVNSDPSRIEEVRGNEKKDERRSRGALCAISACTVHSTLPQILYGDINPGLRTRIQCLVRSAYTETRLPPSLNDILITQPVPAAVSRFRLGLCKGMAKPSYKTNDIEDEVGWGYWIASSFLIIINVTVL
jgi:NAD+ kinase